MRSVALVMGVLVTLTGAVEARRKAKAKPKPAAAMTDDAVVAAVQRAKWNDVILLARGPGDKGPVALLRASRGDQPQVLATIAQPGKAPAQGVILDPVEGNQTHLNARVTPFLDEKDLIDLFVEQSPFVTDGHSTTGAHYIVRRRGAALGLVCRFDGGASSSGKPGVYSGHSVTIEKVMGPKLLTFELHVDATGSDHPGDHQASVARWELPVKGACRPHPTAGEAAAH